MKSWKRISFSLCALMLMLMTMAVPAQAKTTNVATTSLVDVRKAVKPKGKWVKLSLIHI